MDVFFGVLTFILISVSTSHMWSHSKVFQPIRNLISRIKYVRVPLLCPECSSFWIGFGVSWLFNPLLGVSGYIGLVIISNLTLGLITHLIADPLYKKEILEASIPKVDADSFEFKD